MSKKLNKKGNASGMQSFIIILAAIALFVVFTLINPGFASSGNLLTTFTVRIELAGGSMFIEQGDYNEIIEHFARAIEKNHPKRAFQEIPTGWCSFTMTLPMGKVLEELQNFQETPLLLNGQMKSVKRC